MYHYIKKALYVVLIQTTLYTPAAELHTLWKSNSHEIKKAIEAQPRFKHTLGQDFFDHPYPLHYICEHNFIDALIFLHHKGFHLHLLDNNKNTLLHAACKNKSIECVTYLLEECNYPTDNKNIHQETPLMLSVQFPEIIHLLIIHNASFEPFTFPLEFFMFTQKPANDFLENEWYIAVLKRYISRDTTKEIPSNHNHAFWKTYKNTHLNSKQKLNILRHAHKKQKYSLTLP